MFENYSPEARRMIFFARGAAGRLGSKAFEPRHLLLASLQEWTQAGVVQGFSKLLTQLIPSDEVGRLQAAVEEMVPRGEAFAESVDLPLSESAKKVFNGAETIARDHGQREIRPVHVLAALITVDGAMAGVLAQHGVEKDAVFGLMHNELSLILSAARYAAEKHANQKRKGAAGEPYVNHVIEVAHLVSTAVSGDVNVVIAALLHDVIEDTDVTATEMSKQFGQDVTALVMEMTDDKSLPKKERKRLQIEHAPKMSVRAQTIKLADKISNLESILTSPPAGWDYERKRQYFEWGKQVVDALSSPNPLLKAQFEKTYQRIKEIQP